MVTQVSLPPPVGGRDGVTRAYPPPAVAASLEAVRRCAQHLEALRIDGCTFAGGGWEALREALGEAPRLKALDVDRCHAVGACGALVDLLESGSARSLTRLSLTRSDVSPEGVVAVGRAVGRRLAWEALDVSCNGVGPVADLFKAVAGCAGLRELGVAENGVGELGFAALGACLRAGGLPGIERLDLSNNWATDAGVQALAEGLEGRGADLVGPRHLLLDANSLGEDSAEALKRIMRRPGLQTLSLGNNLLPRHTVIDLEGVAAEVSLARVDMSENPGWE